MYATAASVYRRLLRANASILNISSCECSSSIRINSSSNNNARSFSSTLSSHKQVLTPTSNAPVNISAEDLNRFSRKHRVRVQKEQHALLTNRSVDDIRLNTLVPMPGSKKKRVRVGRGIGSGRGGTSRRGKKGQKSRTSVNIPNGFEGGSTPIYKRTPKFGFSNKEFALKYQSVSLEKIQYFIDTGRIANDGTITMKTLYDAGLVSRIKWPGIKLLSNGKEHFKAKIDIEVPRASVSSIKAIEQNGGSVRCIYYQKRALHALLHPEKYEGPVKMPMPPPKLYKYYMRSDIRGYMADNLPVHSLRDVVPDNERNVTQQVGVAYLEAYLKQQKKEKQKQKKK